MIGNHPDLHLARWRRYRAMPILAELEQLHGMGGRGSVFVVDDNFVGNKTLTHRLESGFPHRDAAS